MSCCDLLEEVICAVFIYNVDSAHNDIIFLYSLLQSINFVGHHIRRTTATVLLHLLLPLMYCVGLGIVEPQWSMVCVRAGGGGGGGGEENVHYSSVLPKPSYLNLSLSLTHTSV